jgi:hypothetical protein
MSATRLSRSVEDISTEHQETQMPTYIDPATALRIAHAARDEDIRRAERYRLARRVRDPQRARSARPGPRLKLLVARLTGALAHPGRPVAAR